MSNSLPRFDSRSAIERTNGWNSTSTPRCWSCDTYGCRCSRLSATNVTLQRSDVRISRIASIRIEPASWSGVSMQASITSTRIVAQRSRSDSTLTPLARCAVQRGRPFVRERGPVHDLVSLDAGGLVGARGLPLEVDDRRGRLVVDLAARRAHGEREVRVLVVRGRVARVEAAELAKQLHRDRDACARAVVDLAHVVVLGSVRVVVAPPVPRRPVAPDDAARLLQPAVRIDELGADEPRVRVLVEHAQDGLEPPLRHDRVVVEEHDELAARHLRAPVARADEAQVLAVALESHTRDAGERGGGRFRRSVVDDDDLDHVVRRVRVQALEARVREQRLAVDRDHDRRQRGRRARELERRDDLLLVKLRRHAGLVPLLRLDLGAHAIGQRAGPLVAQDRQRHARQLRQPPDPGAPRAEARARHLRARRGPCAAAA